MKVCVVGHHVDNPDEGARNVTFFLSRELGKRHQVLAVDVKKVVEWRKIRTSRPDVIHFVLGPSSFLSLLVVKLVSLLHRPAVSVMSAVQPFRPRFIRGLALVGPDLVLAQSNASVHMFSNAGFRVALLPNGVDTDKFGPVSLPRKMALREKYNVAHSKFVILHVGAVNRGRNVHLLASLQGEDRQVIVVGRPSEAADLEVLDQMRQSGCLVWMSYFPQLEEIYGLSDCYVFPCNSKYNAIDLPLSVLEAMSCNLPVIAMRFGGLPDVLAEGDGLVFAEDERSLIQAVREVSYSRPMPMTRRQAMTYSWENIAVRLESFYAELQA